MSRDADSEIAADPGERHSAAAQGSATGSSKEWLPKISVVIPTHGRAELVRRAIDSVVHQDYAGVIECIVVHDKEEADPSLNSDDAMRPVRVKKNDDHKSGLPGARNSGMELVTGELIASLDDDDTWLPSKVTEQVALLRENPDVLVVATSVIFHLPNGRQSVRSPRNLRVRREDFLYSRIPEVHSSNMMMRREVFSQAGRYDEDLVGVEDYDWLLRATDHTDILVTEQALVHVYRDTPLWGRARWQRIANAHQQIIERHPELLARPRSAAVYCGRIAFAHAAGGHRRQALHWVRLSTRHRPGNRWAVTAFLISVAGLPPRWVQHFAAIFGKSI